MKATCFLISIALLSITPLIGQNENNEFSEAEDLFLNNRFGSALPHYLNLLKQDSFNATLNFRIGVCYLNSRSQKEKAVTFLNRAVLPTTTYYSGSEKKQSTDPIDVHNLLGICHETYNMDQLDNIYNKFGEVMLASKGKKLSTIEIMDLKSELNKITNELEKFNAAPICLKIETIDKDHHSSFVNYSSSLSSGQSVIFTFQKPFNKNEKSENDKFYFEDAKLTAAQSENLKAVERLIALGDKELASLDPVRNNNGNEATISTSDDNQTVLSYRDTKGDGNLYLSRLSGNQWTVPEKLAKTINTMGWEPNECISADGSTLYFTSDRPGGFGGMDIYKSKKTPTGEWGRAVNLGPVINTAYDDRAPFILPDGKTLYFSSNGHKKVAAFDIFSSTLSDNGIWSSPVNVGFPVSKATTEEVVLPKQSTNKNAKTPKEVALPEKENYLVTFTNKLGTPITVLRGKIMDLAGRTPERTGITISDNESGEFVSSFYSNSPNGKFLFILPPGKNNNITYRSDGCFFHSENVDLFSTYKCCEVPNMLQMPAIAEGSKIALRNIFFDSTKATLRPSSNVELNNLCQLLISNPKVVIEIGACVISKDNSSSNKKLALERSQAIGDYLISKGINKENLIIKGNVKPPAPVLLDKPTDNFPCKPFDQFVELRIVKVK